MPSKAKKTTKLVIVESPTKAKTIGRFIGKGYTVESSYGHVRDLPKSTIGIDTENNFEPKYIVPRKNQKAVTHLKKLAKNATSVILATDEDREGEAIAWHLTKVLDLDNPEKEKKEVSRIVFHEITESAIVSAIKNPRALDVNLVDAQQARRVLDRLVGYKLSPFLWKKVVRGLSAGRVQSVALRLIAEREDEIQAFKAVPYYTIEASFTTPSVTEPFSASLEKIHGTNIPDPGIPTKEEAEKILAELQKAAYSVTHVEKKEMRKNPLAPFTTSTLQQAGAQRLKFSAKKTMFLAQNLYEHGFITYMRTDSVNLSQEALDKAVGWITDNLGAEYAVNAPRKFASKSRLAQEAHEAIRPTEIANKPGALGLDKDLNRLYELIWKRFVASQLPQAVFETNRVEIQARDEKEEVALLTLSGSILKFDGFLKIWPTSFEDKEIPVLQEGEKLNLEKAELAEHFTEPPPRFTEASLIKTLEKFGIGRPSTYAPIISVIQIRNYVKKEKGHFQPTEIGMLANKVISENFPQIVDIQFTATMEDSLDDIAEGKRPWRDVIGEFYKPFAENLEKKYEEVSKKEITEEATDVVCDKCGKPMIIKLGRFGRFMACSGYPDCKNTKPLPKEAPKSIGLPCPKCGQADIVERRVSRGRARGKIFWGCARYPDCDYASWTDPRNPEEKEKAEAAAEKIAAEPEDKEDKKETSED